MRITLGAAVACIALGGICTAHDADAAIKSRTDIPPQALAPALQALVKERNIQLVYRSELIGDQRTAGASGDLTAVEALGQLLNGTGLAYKYLDEKTITILAAGSPDSPANEGARASDGVATPSAGPQTSASGADGKGAQKSSFWERFRVAQVGREAAGGASSVEPAASPGLEEITVTAQRREENSQKVPIVINTISGDQLSARGADSVAMLSAAVPNLNVTGSFNSNVYIRGVGANSASPNNEPSTAVYVDGVYMPSNLGLRTFAFNNIERVEVLKGPQGTLFGRNATAGVVQFITPNPKQQLGGKFDMGYANYDTRNADAYLTGGITDNLAADVSVLYEDQKEGWGYNPTYRTGLFWHKNVAARSKWLYTPSESTSIGVAFDYSEFRSDGGNNQLVPGSVGVDKVTTFPGKFAAVGVPNVNDNDQRGASVRIDQDFGSLHGASITSYRNVSGHWRVDNDLTPAPRVQVDNYNDANYVTQELQLSNRDPGRVTWLAGAFLYGNRVKGADPQANQGTNVAGGYRANFGVQETRSVSGFGQATAEIVADTKLTLGLRYTDETLKTDGRVENLAGQVVSGPFHSQIDFSPWTWRVALDHQFNPDVLGYVSYNRGFKSGGYNLSSPGSLPFFPETVDAYEVGVKSELLNRRMRLNLGMFYYDYKNLQVAVVPGGGSQIFTNAAAARNYGLDATLDVAATDNLSLSVGVGLLDAKYNDYPNAQGFTNRGVAIPIANAKGQSLPYAPKFSGNVSADYRLPTSIGDFQSTLAVSYTGVSYITPDQGLARPSYTLLSSSVEWRPQFDKTFGVRVWGKNLLNKYYYASGVESANGWYITPAPPRTYGLTLLKEF
jgi:iron complex outermembrane receptor protein